jgi:hypothetical protein
VLLVGINNMTQAQLIKNLRSEIDLQSEEIKRLNKLIENMAVLNIKRYREAKGRLKSNKSNLKDSLYQDDIRRG